MYADGRQFLASADEGAEGEGGAICGFSEVGEMLSEFELLFSR